MLLRQQTRPYIVLDPTVEPERETVQPAPRPANLDGQTIALLANGKANAEQLLREVVVLLRERYVIKDVIIARKDNASVVASQEMVDSLVRRATVAITAVGD